MENVFDAVFNGMAALQQVIMLIAGLVLFMIGAALIYEDKRFRKKARRHQATLVGLREGRDGDNQASYYPVAEYMGAGGTMIRAECDSGSSTYINKTPGSQITIYVDPAKPNKFRLPGKVFFIVGVIFAVVGAGVSCASVAMFKMTVMTPIVGAGFLLWGYFKFNKYIKPRELWESPAEFMERTHTEFKDKREALPMLDKAAVEKTRKKNDQNIVRFGWIGIAIGLALCGGGYWTGQNLLDMLNTGAPVTGTVVDLQSHSDSDGTTYNAVIEFEDAAHMRQRFTDRVGSSSPLLDIGEEVRVLYKENEPDKAIVDRGVWNWALPGGLMAAGVLLSWLAGAQYARASRRVSRV